MVALGYLHSAIYRHAVTSAPVSRNSAPCAAFQRRRASRFPLDESRCYCRRRALSCRRRRAKKANKMVTRLIPGLSCYGDVASPTLAGTLTLGSGRFCFSGERLRWSGGSIACAPRHSRTFSVASNALRLGLADRCRFPAVGSTSTKFMTVFQPLNCRHFATALFISDVMSISGQYRKPPRSSAKSGITVNLSSIDSRGRKTPAKPHSTQSALQ